MRGKKPGACLQLCDQENHVHDHHGPVLVLVILYITLSFKDNLYCTFMFLCEQEQREGDSGEEELS